MLITNGFFSEIAFNLSHFNFIWDVNFPLVHTATHFENSMTYLTTIGDLV